MNKPNQKQENRLFKKGFKYIAGVDEAGRGPLAGPIVAAAVIFKKGVRIKGINDSKKLSAKQRELLYKKITEKAYAFSIEKISARQIDKLGLQKANEKVIIKAVRSLKKKPDFLLIDYFKINIKIPNKSIIKGDEKIFSIAAASILAKVERDRIMTGYHQKYNNYDFINNMGYGTKKHLQALKKYGPSSIHRKSFKPFNIFYK
ncbi:MAG: ribonuclease HII [Patescibacteria group bacterium]|nr:ribonuclease HII [Patescibacteria group bacterium]